MKARKKTFAKWTLFFLFAALSNFAVNSYRIMELYENHFKSFTLIIFLLFGFGLGSFFLFFKKKQDVNPLIYLSFILISSSVVIFSSPFLFFGNVLSLSLEILSIFFTMVLGINVVFLLHYILPFVDLKEKEKESFWVYFGIIIGALSAVILSFALSIFNANLMILIFLFIAGFTLSQKLLKAITSLIIFYVFIIMVFVAIQIFNYNIYCPNKTSQKFFLSEPLGGIFSTQLNLGQETITNKNMLGISDIYHDPFPTYKPIFINGRRYGELIQALPKTNYPDYTLYKVIYGLKKPSHVLILNGGGNHSVYVTHQLTNSSIDVVEKNQSLLDVIKDSESLYVGGIYHTHNTIFYRSSGRAYINSSKKKYDSVVIPYTIYFNNTTDLHSQEENLLSIQAIFEYMMILKNQGSCSFVIHSDSSDILESVIFNLVKTLYVSLHQNENQFLDHVKIFSISNTVALYIQKDSFTLDENNTFQALLQEKKLINNLDFTVFNNNLNHHLEAILTNNLNDLSDLKTPLMVISDSQPYWLYLIKSKFAFFSDFNLKNIRKIIFIFVLTAFFAVGFIFICMKSFKKTLSKKIQLPGVVTYFLGDGLSCGMIVVCFAEFFSFFMQREIIPGALILGEFLIVSILGILVFKLFRKRITRITISSIFCIGMLIVYIMLASFFFQQSLFEHTLLVRFSILLFIFGLVFFALLTPFVSGTEWLEYFDMDSRFISYTVYYFSLLIGIIIATLLSLLASLFLLLILALIFRIVSYVNFILMHKYYQKVNFLYRRSGY